EMIRSLLLLIAVAAVAGCDGAPSGPASSPPPGPLGPGASLGGLRPFPADNPWNVDVSTAPIDPSSSTLIASCGNRNLHPDFGTVWDGAPNGIPYVVVDGSQPRVPVTFEYADE